MKKKRFPMRCHSCAEKAIQEYDCEAYDAGCTQNICGFFSTPVRKHGGLMCIALCLSVCDLTKIQTGPKFRLDRKSLDQISDLPKGLGFPIPVKLLDIFNDIGSWAHFNVKLHFFEAGLIKKLKGKTKQGGLRNSDF